MQKNLAKFFLILFLLQSTQLGELLKMPALVMHFTQHRQENTQISIFDFFRIHYWEKQPIDADYAQDMQLPFKTLDNHNLAMQLSLPPIFPDWHPVTVLSPKSVCVHRIPHYISRFSASIFQPPKFG